MEWAFEELVREVSKDDDAGAIDVGVAWISRGKRGTAQAP